MSECYIGLMSGTSADSVDAVLVRFDPELRQLASYSHPIAPDLKARIRATGAHTRLGDAAQLDVVLGELFADAANALLKSAGIAPEQVRAIGSHGQTVWHAPGSAPPYTIQLGDPNVIAERTGITTVADFRRHDIAAGGQGAPLAPAFHRSLFGCAGKTRVVLNLGGIANISVLVGEQLVEGFDTGPANALLDAWIFARRGQPFDRDGEWAAGGEPDSGLLARLLSDPYFEREPPKSTGLEHFNLAWLQGHLDALARPLADRDVQATLAELTVRTVAKAIAARAKNAERVLVCGGGAHNSHLMRRLGALLAPITVESTAAVGVDPDFVEACAFAWLARETLNGRYGNAPVVTGAKREVILGGIYPGRRLI